MSDDYERTRPRAPHHLGPPPTGPGRPSARYRPELVPLPLLAAVRLTVPLPISPPSYDEPTGGGWVLGADAWTHPGEGWLSAGPGPAGGVRLADMSPAEDVDRPRVLIVDDEPAVREALRRSLEFEGYATETAVDGVEALERIRASPPQLVLLDVLMPRMDGLTVARRLRATGVWTPILILTARDTVGDRVTGLDAGADDYLVKPFELDELLARMRALLRRSAHGAGESGDEALTFADLRLDPRTREVTRAGRPIELTRTEYTLLELFLTYPRQVLTREQILRTVWGFDFEPASNSLDVYVMYLRRKTEAGGAPRLVHTVRGVGYVLRESPDPPRESPDSARESPDDPAPPSPGTPRDARGTG